MFEHDCNKCISLGSFQDHDLYFCKQGSLPTVIARFGNNPEDYKSGLIFADIDPELSEAKKRAISRSLILSR